MSEVTTIIEEELLDIYQRYNFYSHNAGTPSFAVNNFSASRFYKYVKKGWDDFSKLYWLFYGHYSTEENCKTIIPVILKVQAKR